MSLHVIVSCIFITYFLFMKSFDFLFLLGLIKLTLQELSEFKLN